MKSKFAVCGLLFVLLASSNARADMLSITADSFGSTSLNLGAAAGYFVGDDIGAEYRNFFTFSLSDPLLTDSTISAATLRLRRGRPTDDGSSNNDNTESIRFYSLSSSNPLFGQIGTGTDYGLSTIPGTVPPGGEDIVVDLVLNGNAVAGANTAIGGSFSLGGILETINENNEFLFQSTGPQLTDAQLQIVFAPVPEASSLAMCGIAIGGAGYFQRRRRLAKA